MRHILEISSVTNAHNPCHSSLWEDVLTKSLEILAQIILLSPHGSNMYVHLARGCQRDSISVVFWRCDDGKGLPAQQCEARANNIIIDKRLEKSGYKLYRTIFIIIIIITHSTGVEVDGGWRYNNWTWEGGGGLGGGVMTFEALSEEDAPLLQLNFTLPIHY